MRKVLEEEEEEKEVWESKKCREKKSKNIPMLWPNVRSS